MEAALATDAKEIIGSDIESSQIKATNSNLDWLMKERIISPEDVGRFKVFACDARHLEANIDDGSVDAVVTEGSLGPLLKGSETRDVLEKNAGELIKLWRETLVTLRGLLRSHGRIVCVWPTFVTSRGSAHVSLSAKELSELGYSRIGSPLLYERPNQRVKRNIIVLEKG
jgi:tRNA G10  N-methylase Trm11